MKKNPGRKERRRIARLDRRSEGRKKAKHNELLQRIKVRKHNQRKSQQKNLHYI